MLSSDRKLFLQQNCPIHDDLISSVIMTPDESKPLICNECIKILKIDINQVESIKKLIDNASLFYEKLNENIRSRDELLIPFPILDFSEKKEDNLSKFFDYLNERKKRVKSYTETYIANFKDALEKRMAEIFKLWDNEADRYHENYDIFVEKFNRYYSIDSMDTMNPRKDALIEEINGSQNYKTLENIILRLKSDVLESRYVAGKSELYQPPKEDLERMMKEVIFQKEVLTKNINIMVRAHEASFQSFEYDLHLFGKEVITMEPLKMIMLCENKKEEEKGKEIPKKEMIENDFKETVFQPKIKRSSVRKSKDAGES